MTHVLTRGEENFEKWKLVVGLPKHFPELRLFPDEDLEDKTFLGPRTDKIEDIDLTIGVPLSYVIVEKGHGASTLCRYVFRRVENDSLKRKIIPIRIDLDEYWKSLDMKLDLVGIIKKGIIYHLASEPWEKALFPPEYYNIINAYDKKDLFKHKAEIWTLVAEQSVDWDKVHQLCPFFAESIDRILNALLEKFSLKTVLFFDIPFDAEVPEGESRDQYVTTLMGYVKDLYEMHRIPEGGLSEIYFLTRNDLELINAVWSRKGNQVEYGAWAYNEIFAILSRHYIPLRTFGGRYYGKQASNLLGIVLSDKFVELVWSRNKTLHQIVDDMKKLIIERLDVDWKDAPYRLEPSLTQIRRWEESRKK
jgi:hypothetical protein